MSPSIGPTVVRVYSDTLDQWFDFATMRFAPAPVKIGAPLVPKPNNRYARNAPFVILKPGEYRIYTFLLLATTVDGVETHTAEDDFSSVEIVIIEANRSGRVVNITVNQPK